MMTGPEEEPNHFQSGSNRFIDGMNWSQPQKIHPSVKFDRLSINRPILPETVEFVDKQELTGEEKPFACDTCDKTFKYRIQLRKHKQNLDCQARSLNKGVQKIHPRAFNNNPDHPKKQSDETEFEKKMSFEVSHRRAKYARAIRAVETQSESHNQEFAQVLTELGVNRRNKSATSVKAIESQSDRSGTISHVQNKECQIAPVEQDTEVKHLSPNKSDRYFSAVPIQSGPNTGLEAYSADEDENEFKSVELQSDLKAYPGLFQEYVNQAKDLIDNEVQSVELQSDLKSHTGPYQDYVSQAKDLVDNEVQHVSENKGDKYVRAVEINSGQNTGQLLHQPAPPVANKASNSVKSVRPISVMEKSSSAILMTAPETVNELSRIVVNLADISQATTTEIPSLLPVSTTSPAINATDVSPKMPSDSSSHPNSTNPIINYACPINSGQSTGLAVGQSQAVAVEEHTNKLHEQANKVFDEYSANELLRGLEDLANNIASPTKWQAKHNLTNRSPGGYQAPESVRPLKDFSLALPDATTNYQVPLTNPSNTQVKETGEKGKRGEEAKTGISVDSVYPRDSMTYVPSVINTGDKSSKIRSYKAGRQPKQIHTTESANFDQSPATMFWQGRQHLQKPAPLLANKASNSAKTYLRRPTNQINETNSNISPQHSSNENQNQASSVMVENIAPDSNIEEPINSEGHQETLIDERDNSTSGLWSSLPILLGANDLTPPTKQNLNIASPSLESCPRADTGDMPKQPNQVSLVNTFGDNEFVGPSITSSSPAYEVVTQVPATTHMSLGSNRNTPGQTQDNVCVDNPAPKSDVINHSSSDGLQETRSDQRDDVTDGPNNSWPVLLKVNNVTVPTKLTLNVVRGTWSSREGFRKLENGHMQKQTQNVTNQPAQSMEPQTGITEAYDKTVGPSSTNLNPVHEEVTQVSASSQDSEISTGSSSISPKQASAYRHKCNHCDKGYNNAKILSIHMAQKHSDLVYPQKNCKFCEKAKGHQHTMCLIHSRSTESPHQVASEPNPTNVLTMEKVSSAIIQAVPEAANKLSSYVIDLRDISQATTAEVPSLLPVTTPAPIDSSDASSKMPSVNSGHPNSTNPIINYVCPFCNIDSKDKHSLQIHLSQFHSKVSDQITNNSIVASIGTTEMSPAATKPTALGNNLIAIPATVTNDICHKSTAGISTLQLGLTKTPNSSSKTKPITDYVCPYCDNDMKDKNLLQIHLINYSGPTTGCRKAYKRQWENGICHIPAPGISNLQLEPTNTPASNAYSGISDNMPSDSSFTAKPITDYVCPFCNKDSKDKQSLQIHLSQFHSEVSNQITNNSIATNNEPEMSPEATSLSALANNLTVIPATTDICHNQEISSLQLGPTNTPASNACSGTSDHMPSDSTAKPTTEYICPFCDNDLKDKDSLHKHLRDYSGPTTGCGNTNKIYKKKILKGPTVCPHCNTDLKDFGVLQSHLRGDNKASEKCVMATKKIVNDTEPAIRTMLADLHKDEPAKSENIENGTQIAGIKDDSARKRKSPDSATNDHIDLMAGPIISDTMQPVSTMPEQKRLKLEQEQVVANISEDNSQNTKEMDESEKFSCLMCNFKTFSEEKLRNHELTHTVDDFLLNECDTLIGECSSFVEKGPMGNQTGGNFSTEEKSQKLNQSTGGSESLGADTKRQPPNNVPKHSMKLRQRGQTLPCPKCDQKFNLRSSLEEHEASHLNLSACKDVTIKNGTIEDRDQVDPDVTHIPVEWTHKCDKCDKKFTKETDMLRHKLTHLGVPIFSCAKCPYLTNSSSSLMRHQNYYHYSLPKLQKKLETEQITNDVDKNLLQIHLINYSGPTTGCRKAYKRQWENGICHIPAPGISNLQLEPTNTPASNAYSGISDNMPSDSSFTAKPITDYVCPFCNKDSKDKQSLQIHLSQFHSEVSNQITNNSIATNNEPEMSPEATSLSALANNLTVIPATTDICHNQEISSLQLGPTNTPASNACSGTSDHMPSDSTAKPTTEYICPFCDNDLKDKDSLHKHLRDYSGPTTGCGNTNKIYKKKILKGPTVCPHCNTDLKDFGVLQSHLRGDNKASEKCVMATKKIVNDTEPAIRTMLADLHKDEPAKSENIENGTQIAGIKDDSARKRKSPDSATNDHIDLMAGPIISDTMQPVSTMPEQKRLKLEQEQVVANISEDNSQNTKEMDESEKFSCLMCNFKTFSEEKLRNHELTHTVDDFLLNECDTLIGECSSFVEKGPMGNQTGGNFSTEEKSQKLNQSTGGSESLGADTKRQPPNNVPKHSMKLRQRGQTLPCPKCDQKFNLRSSLEEHEASHLNLSACKDVTIKNGTIEDRDQVDPDVTHIPVEWTHKCDKCDKKFTKETDMLRHKLTHLGVPIFSCAKCPYLTNSSSSLMRHQNYYHYSLPKLQKKLETEQITNDVDKNSSNDGGKASSKVTKPNIANEKSFLKQLLEDNRKTNLSNQLILETTPQMGVAQPSNGTPTTESQQESPDKNNQASPPSPESSDDVRQPKSEENLTCQESGKVVSSAVQNTVDRMPCKHKMIRTVNNCQKCGKTLSTSNALKKHARICNGKTPLRRLCMQCGMLFTQRIDLQRHLETKHHQMHLQVVFLGES